MSAPCPSRPLRVLCFSPYPVEGASVRHRICAFAPLWERDGIELTLHSFMSPALFRDRRKFGAVATISKMVRFAACTGRLLRRIPTVGCYDAVIIHREAFPLGSAVVERFIARRNPRLIFDVDDAIWTPPSNPVNQRGFLWDSERVPDILRRSKLVVVGSSTLREYAIQYNPHVVVVPTTYEDLGEPNREPNPRAPVLLWIGNWANASYVKPLFPILDRLAERFSFTLRLVGGADIHGIRATRFSIEHCAWNERSEAEWLRTSDVGLMPLIDGPYERGKCSFKLIQYFSAGLPVVASPVGMNAEVVQHGVNGYLASEPEQWHSALEALLASREHRAALGRAGRATFLERFSRPRHAMRWSQLLRSVALERALDLDR